MALSATIEARRININAGGSIVPFFCYNGLDRETNVVKAKALKPYFRRLPEPHTARIYPMLLIGQHPTSSDPNDGGGGTMATGAGGFRGIVSPNGVSRTGIPADEIHAIVEECVSAPKFDPFRRRIVTLLLPNNSRIFQALLAVG